MDSHDRGELAAAPGRPAPGRILVAGALLLTILTVVPAGAEGSGPSQPRSATVPEASPAAANSVPLDVAFRFDAQDLVALSDASRLPLARGSATAHWYAVNGWAVVVFEGLDLAASGPLCIGTSAIDPTTGLVQHVSYAPTSKGACDDAGAGAVPLASGATGVRTCHGTVSFVTTIPAELGGPLVATVLVFPGDGTGIGVSGRLDPQGPLGEPDGAVVACGPLPPAREPVPATPVPAPTPVVTPAPPSEGSVPAAERAPAPTLTPVSDCLPAGDGLQDAYAAPSGPYLIRHPAAPGPSTPTIVFLPGGRGSHGGAKRVWETVFSAGADLEAFRVVIPYAADGDLIDQAARTFDILDEVLWCYGGDPMRVHLAGASNGGLAAFGLMARHPERFATLLGAPGAFPVQDPSTVDPRVWTRLLAGRAVLNGVGAFDADWRPEVIATHNALAAAGIESSFVEFPGQGHILGSGFDNSVLLEFWESH